MSRFVKFTQIGTRHGVDHECPVYIDRRAIVALGPALLEKDSIIAEDSGGLPVIEGRTTVLFSIGARASKLSVKGSIEEIASKIDAVEAAG